MSALLTENLPLLAGAPNGIRKLRELILELAVRGKLVPQDPSDEPASELLKRIAEEKARLVAEGKIRKQKPLAEIGEEEKPFELPEGWEWVRLADLAYSQAGFAFKSSGFNDSGLGLPLIRIRDVGQAFSGTFYEGEYRSEFLVEEGDYLISMDGQFRVATWEGGTALLNQRVSRLIFFGEESARRFIADSLQARLLELQGVKAYTTVDHLSGGQISEAVIALPPLAEQHRIVAKVDELMALCDRLEARQADAESAQARLVQALLDSLTQASDADDFAVSWQRLAGHFHSLFTSESSIDALKQTLLQLAVMGKLVPQDPSDEPARSVIGEIQRVKSKLIDDGIIKKSKSPLSILDSEKKFPLPNGWEWARMQSLVDVRDGTHDSPKAALSGHTYPLVTSKDFQNGSIIFEGAKRISEEDYFEIARRSFVERYDILFSMIGGNIGNQVMVDTDEKFAIKNVALFKYYDKKLTFPFFIKLVTDSIAIDLQEAAIGGAQPFVALGALRNLVIALPPVAEQHRIVAKVNQLMALCDQLKSRLTAARQLHERLAGVLVEQAVA
jgi:type I restriction enzyme S subunit